MNNNKGFAGKRTMNPPNQEHAKKPGDPHQANKGEQRSQQQQDEQRRMGSFEGRGTHARAGSKGHQ